MRQRTGHGKAVVPMLIRRINVTGLVAQPELLVVGAHSEENNEYYEGPQQLEHIVLTGGLAEIEERVAEGAVEVERNQRKLEEGHVQTTYEPTTREDARSPRAQGLQVKTTEATKQLFLFLGTLCEK